MRMNLFQHGSGTGVDLVLCRFHGQLEALEWRAVSPCGPLASRDGALADLDVPLASRGGALANLDDPLASLDPARVSVEGAHACLGVRHASFSMRRSRSSQARSRKPSSDADRATIKTTI